MNVTDFLKVQNNAESTLAEDLTDIETGIDVQTGDGALFPTPGTAGFYATIWNEDQYPNPGDDPDMEIVWVSGISTDTLTVTRGQLGTTGVAHSTGHTIALLVNERHIEELQEAVNRLEFKESFEDCINGPRPGGGTPNWAGTNGWSATWTGTLDSLNTMADADHPGVWTCETDSLTSTYVAIHYGWPSAPSILLGGGRYVVEAMIKIEDLADGTDDYDIRFGFGDSVNADFTNGVYFEYDRDTRTNWSRCVADNGSRTKTDTSVAVAADAWIKLRIEINAAGTSAEFFINGTSVGTHSSGIPTASGRYAVPVLHIAKEAGTTDRKMYVDYLGFDYDLTNSR